MWYAALPGMPRSRWVPLRAVAVLGVLVAFLWASYARAYCREVTASPPGGYDPADAGCFVRPADAGADLPPLFWRNQCVGYSLQRNASKQVALDEASRIAAQAFATWSNASCEGGGSPSINTSFAYPPVDCSGTSEGHNNPIIFRDNVWPYNDHANAIGFTTLTVVLATGEIVGASIEINSHDFKITVDAGAPEGAYDLSSIMTHEVGHFLGLAHSTDPNAVMYAFYQTGSTTLSPDDVAGICSTYTPDGARSTQSGPLPMTICEGGRPFNGFLTECGSIDAGFGTVGSGAAVDGGARSAPCSNLFSCAISRARGSSQGSGATAFGVCGLVVLGALARRAKRHVQGSAGAWSRHRCASRRARIAALGISLATLATGATGVQDAVASVSVTVLFDELVQKASAAAVVTRAEQRGLWEDGRIVTYTRVHVDRLVAGQLAGDVWVRTLGGAVGGIGQIVEGEATFPPGRPSLVFLRPHLAPVSRAPTGAFAAVEGAQGEFPIATGEEQPPRLTLARDIGALVPPAPGRTPTAGPARLARDVLRDRPLEDAAREIAAAWPRMHAG
jgi:hypothetical protein